MCFFCELNRTNTASRYIYSGDITVYFPLFRPDPYEPNKAGILNGERSIPFCPDCFERLLFALDTTVAASFERVFNDRYRFNWYGGVFPTLESYMAFVYMMYDRSSTSNNVRSAIDTAINLRDYERYGWVMLSDDWGGMSIPYSGSIIRFVMSPDDVKFMTTFLYRFHTKGVAPEHWSQDFVVWCRTIIIENEYVENYGVERRRIFGNRLGILISTIKDDLDTWQQNFVDSFTGTLTVLEDWNCPLEDFDISTAHSFLCKFLDTPASGVMSYAELEDQGRMKGYFITQETARMKIGTRSFNRYNRIFGY